MVSLDEFEENPGKYIFKGAMIGVLVIIALIVLFGSFYTIESGEEGVLFTFNKANMVAIQPGLHFKIPIVQKIVKFDVKTQKYGDDATQSTLESAASSDLQIVKARVVVNYRLAEGKTPEIFSKVGLAYRDTVILPSVREAMKAATAKYRAEDLINKREDVRTQIEQLLRQKLEPYNIIVEQVSITDFDFSEQYNAAIENKVTAEQKALQAQRDLERIQIEAQQRIAEADGQRQAAIAQAQGEAEKVRLVQEQLQKAPAYVDYVRAQKWDGRLPQFYITGSGGNNMLFQMPLLTTNTT